MCNNNAIKIYFLVVLHTDIGESNGHHKKEHLSNTAQSVVFRLILI